MTKSRHLHPSDVRALARLATDATLGLADLVETMHHTIAGVPRLQAQAGQPRTRGITGLVYNAVRGITTTAGATADTLLAKLIPLFGERQSTPEREAVQAALNGVLGDYLKSTGNPLAIPMRLRCSGRPLALTSAALRAAIPNAGTRLVVLVHGLCMNDLQWRREGHNHGAALAQEFGYTPLYLHYNSGLHTSVNGRAFADLLQTLVQQWPEPVEELDIVCHSMGGLITRSACHYGAQAGHAWLPHLRNVVFLGTPHHGALLERVGNWIDTVLQAVPYAAPFARLGMIRSAGITDLRHGNVLDDDWEGHDRFARGPDRRRLQALPAGVQSYAVAARLGTNAGEVGDRLLGDGLVPLDSALGRHDDPARCLAFPQAHQWVGNGMGHMDLLSQPEVYAQIRGWLGGERRQNEVVACSARSTSD